MFKKKCFGYGVMFIAPSVHSYISDYFFLNLYLPFWEVIHNSYYFIYCPLSSEQYQEIVIYGFLFNMPGGL